MCNTRAALKALQGQFPELTLPQLKTLECDAEAKPDCEAFASLEALEQYGVPSQWIL